MNIVNTRYRDIPWEEAVKCFTPEAAVENQTYWDSVRGKTIQIETPAVPRFLASPIFKCDGPFFKAPDADRGVCAHIAEIGD